MAIKTMKTGLVQLSKTIYNLTHAYKIYLKNVSKSVEPY